MYVSFSDILAKLLQILDTFRIQRLYKHKYISESAKSKYVRTLLKIRQLINKKIPDLRYNIEIF
jgi:hypothetical protein